MLETIPSIRSLVFESKQIVYARFSYLSKIDWTDEFRLILTALIIASIILVLQQRLFASRPWQRLASWIGIRISMPRSSSRSRAGPICARPSNPNDSTRRTVFTDDSVAIYAWPSRGGVIILKEATRVDFVFLGLSTVDPPCKRDRGNGSIEEEHTAVVQQREDAFCQRLLLLGAKWWDSEERSRFVSRLGGGDQPAIANVEAGRAEEPTLRERRWVKVGGEGIATDATASSTSHGETIEDGDGNTDKNGSGGLWVLDCDTNMHGVLEEDNMVPVDAGRLCLARSMKERCEILKRLGATFFGDLKEYKGDATFLRAWEWKWDGEIGEMLKCQ